ncbi:pgam5 [Symbiodinium microadriaticum]|nr:pgam5 [Symbiodinium microadriaticum]
MLHRGLQALRRPGRGVTLGRTWWSPSRSASSLRDRLLPKLPKGYWLPTIAVGCFTIVSSGALFDLAIRWISRREEDSDEWMEDWDEQLLEDGGFPEDIAAALAAGRGLRQIHENVGTRHVFFIRHAQPGDGEPLTPLGRRQAEATAQRLQSQIANCKRKVIFHSPAPEAKATAEIIQKALGKVRTKESPLLAEGIPVVARQGVETDNPQVSGLTVAVLTAGEQAAQEGNREVSSWEVLTSDGARAEGALRTHVVRALLRSKRKPFFHSLFFTVSPCSGGLLVVRM